jgi:hypothetical protein
LKLFLMRFFSMINVRNSTNIKFLGSILLIVV